MKLYRLKHYWVLLMLGCVAFAAGPRGTRSLSLPKMLHGASLHGFTAAGNPNLQFAIADFDGDKKPDLATVEVERTGSRLTRYSILFHLASGVRAAVGVSGAFGGLQILPRDVNGDRALDLIVRAGWLHQTVAVLLNDGYGNFTASSPSLWASAVPEQSQALSALGAGANDASPALNDRLPLGDRPQRGSLAARQSVTIPFFRQNTSIVSSLIHSSRFGRAPPAAV